MWPFYFKWAGHLQEGEVQGEIYQLGYVGKLRNHVLQECNRMYLSFLMCYYSHHNKINIFESYTHHVST